MKKVAVITGASSGIGSAIAQYYYNKGDHVIGVSRSVGPIPYVSKQLSHDLSNIDTIEAAISQIKDFGFNIDVLVNNAGQMWVTEDMEITNYDYLIGLDLLCPSLFCRLLGPYFNEGGHVINIASVSGIMNDPDVTMYSACKAAVISLTKSLAKAWAPDIRVNCISPGFFKTNLVAGDTPQELIDNIPLKREAETWEIVPVIDMLEKCTYMTGANIVIDGGLSA